MSDETIIRAPGPRQVGKYVLNGELGRGAMGVVFDAHDPDIDRPVAIKTIHRHLIEAAGGEEWLARFSREARAAGRVLHPNLVTIFDYIVHDGMPYLVMERLDASSTLEDRLTEKQGLALSEVAAIMCQMLDGLTAIHEVSIIHRDMKPANVMMTRMGVMKLTDFGIARFTSMDRTGAGMIGTPAYMAPEQFAGTEVDARADIYATGVVLYQILTGKLPFVKGGIEAVMLASSGGSVTAPSALVPDIPTALDDVVLRAISADPMGRFADAAEMKAALNAAIGAETGATAVRTAGAPRGTARASAETMITKLSGAAMNELENSLVTKIGPMGKILARRAAQTAGNRESLVEQILNEAGSEIEREELRRLVEANLPTETGLGTGAGGAADLPEEDLKRLVTALTPYLGPIAGRMVRQKATSAQSFPVLVERLAETITDTNDRATFLSMAPKDR